MSCASEPAGVFPDKHPNAILDYAVDFELECARQWNKWTDFSAGVRIRVFRSGVASGYEFEATTGGRAGGRPPIWSDTGTIRDGSVIWTPRAISSSSLLRTIVGTPTWTVDTGLTVLSMSVVGLKGIANLGDGVDGQDYAIAVTATGSDGLEIVKECILPVRIPVRQCS